MWKLFIILPWKWLEYCRSGKGPAFIEALTYRMRGHGEQDRQHYVDPGELKVWAARCPIQQYRQKLLNDGVLNQAQIQTIDQDIETGVAAAVAFADASPYPGPETVP